MPVRKVVRERCKRRSFLGGFFLVPMFISISEFFNFLELNASTVRILII